MSRPLSERDFYSLEAPGVVSEATERFRRLCYGLCFFHGVVVARIQVRWRRVNWHDSISKDRRVVHHRTNLNTHRSAPQYGAIGWNQHESYEFSHADLALSLNQLRERVKMCENKDLLAEALRATQYLVSECNYGGRIIDKYDRRLLKVSKRALVMIPGLDTLNIFSRLCYFISTMKLLPHRHIASCPSPDSTPCPRIWPWRR